MRTAAHSINRPGVILKVRLSCTAGEINTLQGNLNWVASREHSLTHPAWDGREADFLPLTSPAASDSANLDMLAEFLVGCYGFRFYSRK
jgi:glutamate synthase domain-containing protein 1